MTLKHSMLQKLTFATEMQLTMGLSPLEIVALLEKAANPEASARNAERQGALLETDSRSYTTLISGYAAKVRGSIPEARVLETPQVLVNRSGLNFAATYNPKSSSIINVALDGAQQHAASNTALERLIKQISSKREWIETTQASIAEYLCREQAQYIESGNPMDLNPRSQKDISLAVNYHRSIVSRLIHNLTIKLPNEKVIFAKELAPGLQFRGIKINYFLNQISGNPEYFNGGKWQVSDTTLLQLVNHMIGPKLQIGRRWLGNYTRAFEQNYKPPTPTAEGK